MMKYFKELATRCQASAARRGAANHIVSQSSSSLQRRASRHRKSRCIRIVKWFYVEYLESLAYAPHVPNELKRLLRSRKEATSGTRLWVSVSWKTPRLRAVPQTTPRRTQPLRETLQQQLAGEARLAGPWWPAIRGRGRRGAERSSTAGSAEKKSADAPPVIELALWDRELGDGLELPSG
jgi:hypothetical protein